MASGKIRGIIVCGVAIPVGVLLGAALGDPAHGDAVEGVTVVCSGLGAPVLPYLFAPAGAAVPELGDVGAAVPGLAQAGGVVVVVVEWRAEVFVASPLQSIRVVVAVISSNRIDGLGGAVTVLVGVIVGAGSGT